VCNAFGSYHEGFSGTCGVPCYQSECLGGGHLLTLLRGVSYTFRGELNEGWVGHDPGTGRCSVTCEQNVTFTPTTYVEATSVVTQPRIRLSWDNCDPLVTDKSFVGPGPERLVLSATNVSGAYAAHDHTIRVSPQLADAWRFDDAGCQGASQIAISSAAASKTCPPMQGVAPLGITAYLYDPATGDAFLRLANTFNDFAADPTRRYTLWVINFDHSYSVAGPGSPGSTCGGAEQSLNFDVVNSEFLLSTGELIHPLPGETHVTWNGGASFRADAGNDTTVDCAPVEGGGTPVQLDGSRSDMAGTIFLWSAPGVPFDDCSAVRPTGRFPTGVNQVVLTLIKGGIAVRDTVVVTIRDTVSPTLTVTLDPRLLWPPNHKLAAIHADVHFSDACDPHPTVKLISVTSSDPDLTDDSGDEPGDVQGADFGTADFDFLVRSERLGSSAGRDYTVCYEATDASGNVTRVCRTVSVPHDQSGHATVEIAAQTWYLVVFGSEAMAARSVEPASVALGTSDFVSATWSGEAPSYLDVDGDQIEDARFALTQVPGGFTGRDLSAGLFARWVAAGTGYETGIPLSEIVGIGQGLTGGKLTAFARPNPARGSSVIYYSLPASGPVSLRVYDVAGRLVARLVDEVQDAGPHQVPFELSAHGIGSQILLYRLDWADQRVTGRMLIFR
jgi:hypothetical protein